MTSNRDSDQEKTTEEKRASRAVTAITAGVLTLTAGVAIWSLGQNKTASEERQATSGFAGTVTRVSGDGGGLTACDPGGQACRALSAKSELPKSSRVRTDYRTRAEITLADGSRLTLDRGTDLSLSSSSRTAKLYRGGLIAEVAPRANDAVRFELPAGAVRVTGTKFSLRAEGDSASVDVVRGSVALENASGESVMVRAGEVGRLMPGSAPFVAESPTLADSVAWSEHAFTPAPTEQELHRGLGELIAKKPGENVERRSAVTLTSHSVRVRIAGAVARTEVEEVFTNQTDQVLEGIFRFPMPPDAQIERLALEVDGKLEEGAFVDRDRAAAIWRGTIANAAPKAPKPREEIIWVPGPWRDPALLEWQRGGRFELRIFPIPKRGSRRVILAYTQAVPATAGVRRYGYPLPYDPSGSTRVASFSANVEVRGHDERYGVRAAGYELRADRRGEVAGLAFEQRDFLPTGDLLVEYALADRESEVSAWAYREEGASGAGDRRPYVAIALRPKLPRTDQRASEAMALVVDASRSMYGESYRRASELAVKVARELDPGTRLTVLACHAECSALPGGSVEPGAAAAEQVRRFLDGLQPEGASDVVAAVRAGYEAFAAERGRTVRVVYVGDGAPTVGPIRPGTIERAVGRFVDAARATVSSVAVGSDSDAATLRAVARGGGGVMLPFTPGRSASEVAFAILGAASGATLSDVRVELPPGLESVAPASLDAIPAGGEAWLAARLAGSSARGDVILRGRVAGQPFEQRYRLEVNATSARGNAFVPRVFAAARIADLEREGTSLAKKDAIELSSRYSVASRYTSLLVLESAAMFKAFGLDNERRADLWSGEEAAEGTTASGTFELDGDDEASAPGEFAMVGRGSGLSGFGVGGGGLGEGKAKKAESSDAFSEPAPAAAAPRAAPAPAKKPSASGAAPRRNERFDPGDPLLQVPEPSRRMVPMRRIWERFGEVFTDRFTPKAANLDELHRLDRLTAGDSPRREDVKKLFVMLMQLADLEQAARVAERWSEKEPLDPEALTARADVAARRAERERAIRILGSVVDVRPGDVAAHQRLARLWRWAGRPELACRHTLGVAELRPSDATLLADAVRCARETGEHALGDELLANAESAVRTRAEALIGKPRADEGLLKGDLRIEATWDDGTDVDLAFIDPDGHRVSWLGAPTRAVISARDVRSTSREGLALRGGKPGEYVIELVRAGGPLRPRGELTISAAGTTRRVPFTLDADRKSVALVRIGTRAKLVPAGW